jgi:hypothetical protein
MTSTNNALAFYAEHYSPMGIWHIEPGVKIVLEGSHPQTCRFCKRSFPQVTFKLDAHAIPEALGNRGMLSRYECDACNKLFGSTIENDLGHWSKPMRALMRVRGKRGIPTLKSERDGWRIECDDGSQMNISHNRIDNVFEVDEVRKRLRFNLKREPFVPIQVLKAFVKIGLTLLPDDEIHAFEQALTWIRNPPHPNELVVQMPVLRTMVPGPTNGRMTTACVVRRSNSSRDLPYAFLVLAIANETFQVMLPSPEFDPPPAVESMRIPGFPVAAGSHGDPIVATLDFSGTEPVTGQAVVAEMSYEDRVAR